MSSLASPLAPRVHATDLKTLATPEETRALEMATKVSVTTTSVAMLVVELRSENLVMDALAWYVLGVLVLFHGDGQFLDGEGNDYGDGNGI